MTVTETIELYDEIFHTFRLEMLHARGSEKKNSHTMICPIYFIYCSYYYSLSEIVNIRKKNGIKRGRIEKSLFLS